jgi:hypothetical protein
MRKHRIIFHFIMRVMVVFMRLLTRLAPWLARPMVARVAELEIIACGLRPWGDERVTLIYTPKESRGVHRFYNLDQNRETEISAKSTEDFSPGLVRQAEVLSPQIGQIYIIRAPCIGGTPTEMRSSPKIYVKAETNRIDEELTITPLPHGEVRLEWKESKTHDPMIFFLVVEDDTKALVGIYTRAAYWRYPHVGQTSLDVGAENIEPLQEGHTYTSRLLLVDYDGWVSHLAIKKFTYSNDCI